MKYLYTKDPDEGCRKFGDVYGRPVHTHEEKKLKAAGWKENIDGLRNYTETEEEAPKDEEVIPEDDLRKLYEETFGEKPHHKMKLETIRAKLDEELDGND